MQDWLIYRHTSPSGKVYIGITSRTPEIRWRNGSGYKQCVLFYKAIEKYGWDNIYHEVLFEHLPEERAKKLEIDLVRHYKNLGLSYNITDGGDGALGRVPSEETRIKQRNAKLGKPVSEECLKKLRANAEARKGIPRSEEVKRKLHEANKGKKPSPQTVQALKEYMKSHPVSKEVLQKAHEASRRMGYKTQIEVLNRNREQIGVKHRRAVIQLSLQGEYIKKFDGIKFASANVGVDNSAIAACCKGKIRQAKGYLWMYAEDFDKYKVEGNLSSVLGEMVARVNKKIERSETYRRARSEALKGVDHRSDALKEYMNQCSIKAKSKPVLQLSLEGNPLAVYYNGKEAAEAMGVYQACISRCCHNEAFTSQGYKWRFISKEEYEEYKLRLTA